MRLIFVTFGALFLLSSTSGQATSSAIDVIVRAEVEIQSGHGRSGVVKLVPATRVVPGDQVIYTLEIRNTGSSDVTMPLITEPIPAHMRYLVDSATGPGAEVTYSADGGSTFDRPENLQVRGTDSLFHVANPRDYTHIRWKLKNTLRSNSVAYARFRAVVK